VCRPGRLSVDISSTRVSQEGLDNSYGGGCLKVVLLRWLIIHKLVKWKD
jgi:hypothetical protein